jgi:hypothetical protein
MISGLMYQIPCASEQGISEQEQRNSEEEQGIFAALEMTALTPCVDGSELARTFFMSAVLVGAAVSSAFKRGTRGA